MKTLVLLGLLSLSGANPWGTNPVYWYNGGASSGGGWESATTNGDDSGESKGVALQHNSKNEYGASHAKAVERHQVAYDEALRQHEAAVEAQKRLVAQHSALVGGTSKRNSAEKTSAVSTSQSWGNSGSGSWSSGSDDQTHEQAVLAQQQELVRKQTLLAKHQGEAAASHAGGWSSSSSEEGNQYVSYVPVPVNFHPISYGVGYSYKKDSSKEKGMEVSRGEAEDARRMALEAHQRAVEEHQKAYEEAIRTHEAAKAKVSGGRGGAQDDSQEKVHWNHVVSVPMHQVVVVPSVTHAKKYTGPKVTREQTYYLHRNAIMKQNQQIHEQQRAIASQKANRDDSSSEESWSGNDGWGSSGSHGGDDDSDSQEGARLRQDQDDTTRMHEDWAKEKHILNKQKAEVDDQIKIAKQQGKEAETQGEFARIQGDLDYSGSDESSGHDSSGDDSSGDDSGSNEGVWRGHPVSIGGGGAGVGAGVPQAPYKGPMVTREEAEYLHRDAIAKQNEIIRNHKVMIQKGFKYSSEESGDDSDSDSDEKGFDHARYHVPTVAVVSGWKSAPVRAEDAAAQQQAVAVQNGIIAQQKAFIAQQEAVVRRQQKQQQALLKSLGGKDDDSGSSEEGGYAGGYTRFAYGGGDSDESGQKGRGYGVYQRVNVIGPKVTNYLAAGPGHQTQSYYQTGRVDAAPRVHTYAVRVDSSEKRWKDDLERQRAELARHQEVVKQQVSMAKSQGAAASRGKWDSDESSSDEGKNPMYFRYGVPTFGIQLIPAWSSSGSGSKYGTSSSGGGESNEK